LCYWQKLITKEQWPLGVSIEEEEIGVISSQKLKKSLPVLPLTLAKGIASTVWKNSRNLNKLVHLLENPSLFL
jgi:hypothetical protein